MTDTLNTLVALVGLVALLAVAAAWEKRVVAALGPVAPASRAYCRDRVESSRLTADRDQWYPYRGYWQSAGESPRTSGSYGRIRRGSPSLPRLLGGLGGYITGYAAGTLIRSVYTASEVWYSSLRRVAVHWRPSTRQTGHDMDTQDSAASSAEVAPLTHQVSLDIAADDDPLASVTSLVEGLAVTASLVTEHGPAGGNPVYSFRGGQSDLQALVVRYCGGAQAFPDDVELHLEMIEEVAAAQ